MTPVPVEAVKSTRSATGSKIRNPKQIQTMRNTELARTFQEIADILEIKGENIFKVRAYQKAARTIEHWPQELEMVLKEDKLQEIPGVGEAIAKKITELLATGKLQYYEELKADMPEGVTELLKVPGIGPKTAWKLVTELRIKNLEELEKAIADGKVAQLFRMGDKTAENILNSLQAMRRKDRRISLGQARPIVEEIASSLKSISGLKSLTAAGSLRRLQETVGDIDLMGTADDPVRVIDAFVKLPQVKEVLAKGTTKASVILSGGLQVDLRMVDHKQFGSLLQYFTGSKQHNIVLRERAHRMGLKISEYGIQRLNSEELETFADEESFYRRMGLQYIPPELREDRGEIELAEKNALPSLVELADIKGDLHVHTDWSDGHASIGEMALEARKRGYEYIAITDHAAGLGVAHGLSPERLQEQIAEIKKLNREMGKFRIMTGMEVDIKADGTLDMPDDILAQLDVVVASVHSAMNQDEDRMTARVLKALSNLHLDILAHPTARLLGEREPIRVRMEDILKAARKNRKALEINAMPDRLDLKDVHIIRAREIGVKLVLSTDSHNPSHLGLMYFGIGMARRGWCKAEDILNSRSLEEFLSLLHDSQK